MIERHELQGHQILLTLRPTPSGRCLWSWRIDGIHTASGRGLLTEKKAREEALLLARRVVAQWDRMRASSTETIRHRRMELVRRQYAPVAGEA